MRLYPRSWRERYGDEFELVVSAYGPGPRTSFDVVRGAADAHMRALRPAPILRTASLALACVLVGWLNFHATDDVQAVALALLLGGFAFGVQRPARAWLYALVLFAAVPVSGAWADALSYHPGLVKPAPLYESTVALIPAFAGAYTGAAIRWSMGRASR